jgi:uncharacterized membrane protein YcaP (DUF421 family)
MDLHYDLFHIDWRAVLNPQVALLEIVLRGSVIYLSLFFLLRLFRSRHAGETSVSDILLITLIADAVQNAMASEYRSITEGITLALTIFFWALTLDWLAFRFPKARRWIQSGPTCVISNGSVLRPALRKEFISEDELQSMLRHHGVEKAEEVEKAYVESDGRLSVICRKR